MKKAKKKDFIAVTKQDKPIAVEKGDIFFFEDVRKMEKGSIKDIWVSEKDSVSIRENALLFRYAKVI